MMAKKTKTEKNQDRQNTEQNKGLSKTNPTKAKGQFVCFGIINMFCSTSGIHPVALVTNPGVSHDLFSLYV